MKNNLFLMALVAFAQFTFQSCGDVENPPNPNEEELITSVELNFTNEDNSSDVRTFVFKDADGEGGSAPTDFDTIRLASNSVYALNVRFLDESGDTPEDITVEIAEEANDHLVCYTTSAGTSVNITDEDGNKLALGLKAQVTTTDVGTGTFMLSLKHQPDIKTGDCALGDTDVEVTFEMEVE